LRPQTLWNVNWFARWKTYRTTDRLHDIAAADSHLRAVSCPSKYCRANDYDAYLVTPSHQAFVAPVALIVDTGTCSVP
jgi:hypothetical protein